MTEGILVHDLQGIIIDCNQRIEKILGTSRDQMIGRPVSAEFLNACFEDGSRWPSDDHPALVTLRTGIPIREAVMGMRLPSGGLKWVSVNTQVVKDFARLRLRCDLELRGCHFDARTTATARPNHRQCGTRRVGMGSAIHSNSSQSNFHHHAWL